MSALLVKVCGMTNAETARRCDALGVDLVGFIFHPKSPRCVAPSLPAGLDLPRARKVGVFVHQGADEVRDLMERGRLDLAQLHGGQDRKFCRAVGPERVIKALWPERYASLDDLMSDLRRFAPVCRWFLFDAGSSGGGHGRTLAATLPEAGDIPRPWLLAGGLSPETLPAALALGPDGVDLNSGVESAPGVKDFDKLTRALDGLRPGRRSEETI
ncbi:MAG: phosphoribosylanthranilate isomerase [Desulfovibrionaceae bacterium]